MILWTVPNSMKLKNGWRDVCMPKSHLGVAESNPKLTNSLWMSYFVTVVLRILEESGFISNACLLLLLLFVVRSFIDLFV